MYLSSASTISGNVFTGGSLQISGTISTGTLVATTATIPNIIHTSITTNSLLISGGNLNMTGGSINISGGSINITGGSLNVSGNISSSSTISGNVFTGGSLQISGQGSISNLVTTNITTSTLNVNAGIQVLMIGITGGTPINTSSLIRNTHGSLEIAIPAAVANFSTSAIAGDAVFRQNDTSKNMMFNIGAGAATLYIASSGNIGISTSIPNVKLDVAGSTRIVNTTATSVGSLTVLGPGSNTYNPATTTIGQLASFCGPSGTGIISNIDLSTYIPQSGTFNLPSVRFSMLDLGAQNSTFNILTKNSGTTGTMPSRIFIDGSGNVGINTTNSAYTLDVAGAGRFINSTSTNTFASLIVGGPNANGTVPALQTIGSTVLIYNASPAAGVITNVDLSTFHPSINAGTPTTRISLLDLGLANNSFNLLTRTPSNVGSSMASRIFIDGSGNVGIGTTSPTFRLDVAGVIETGNSVASNFQPYSNIVLTPLAGQSNVSEINFNNAAGNRNYIYANAPSGMAIGGNGALQFQTGTSAGSPATYMTLTSSGNLGIGTGSPGETLSVAGPIRTIGSTGILNFWNAAQSTRFGYLYHAGSGSNIELNNQQAGDIFFSTNNSEKMRVTSSGNVGIGTIAPTEVSTVMLMASSGNLTVTGDVLAFGTISDQRLKENVTEISTGLDTINALRPVTFNWKQDIFNKNRAGTRDSGFIAQEVEQVLEHAVSEYTEIETGEKYKNMRHERIIPYLVKAIQELTQQVKLLEKVLSK